jgi:SNF2 family DNA or RNA helicase
LIDLAYNIVFVVLQDEWPLLVIAPASMRLVWAEEFEKWMPHVRPSQVWLFISLGVISI